MHKPFDLMWVSQPTFDEIVLQADSFEPLETGGVLIGYVARGGRELVITNVIGPGPDATHRTTSFEPDLEYQHAEIARFYRASAGQITYIGDWHTHPGGSATVSSKDKRAMLRVASSPAARTPRPIMMILGTDRRHRWTACAWQICRLRAMRKRFARVPIRAYSG